MAILVIFAASGWCLAAISTSLVIVKRLADSRTTVRVLVPIVGAIIGLSGLVAIVDGIQERSPVTALGPGKDRPGADGTDRCRELTFNGWSTWRTCERQSE
jgi:hypothetical protein